MLIEFKPENSETVEYPILRDFYISNGNVQGIQFLVIDPYTDEIKQIFVNKEDINGNYEPRKSDEPDVKLKAYGLEVGLENKLILEKGMWYKKGALNKEIEVPAKRYRFILKKN